MSIMYSFYSIYLFQIKKQKDEFINQKKKLTKGDTELGLTKKKSWSLMRSIHFHCLKFIWFHRAPVTKYFVHLVRNFFNYNPALDSVSLKLVTMKFFLGAENIRLTKMVAK